MNPSLDGIRVHLILNRISYINNKIRRYNEIPNDYSRYPSLL
jgi:hypothetical protein